MTRRFRITRGVPAVLAGVWMLVSPASVTRVWAQAHAHGRAPTPLPPTPTPTPTPPSTPTPTPAGPGMPPQAPTYPPPLPPWGFHLEWNQPEKFANYYQVCVNDVVPCTVLSDAQNAEGDVWRAALPMLPPGEYRLVLQGCTFEGCASGVPDMMIRVSAPADGTAPGDVVAMPPDDVRR